MLYSKSTNGFYDKDIHGDNVPADVVEISHEFYQSLFEGQSEGKLISSNEDGYPILVERPGPTLEEKAIAIRSDRNAKINEVSWRYERHARETRLKLKTTDDIEVLDTYIQALADITKQKTFPESVTWPELK